MATQKKPRTPPEVLDGWRVRTLRGDKLADLSDAQREWVWRSLMKGVRKTETVALGGFSEAQYARGVERVRRWYAQRIAEYKASKPAVQVVRPVKPLAKTARRGFLWFGKGRR